MFRHSSNEFECLTLKNSYEMLSEITSTKHSVNIIKNNFTFPNIY